MSNSLYLRNRLCIPIRGYNRSIIYDLGRGDYFFIPNELYDLIFPLNILDIDEIKKYDEWFELLLKEEIIFTIFKESDVEFFPDISLKYHTSYDILSLIIHNNLSIEQFDKFKDLKILNISIIIDDSKPFDSVYKFVNDVSKREVDSINLFYTGNKFKNIEKILSDLEFIPQLFSITIFNSTQENVIIGERINIIYKKQNFYEFSSISLPEKMTINMEHFTESSNFHSYFNHKVYIDDMGNIKNGLNEDKIFENIKKLDDKEFINLMNSELFRQNWGIKKDNTLICNICEFRHMCNDPRSVYISKNNFAFHKIECSYNPYISLWSNEENYRSLKELNIEISQNGELKMNEETIAEYNNTLWT